MTDTSLLLCSANVLVTSWMSHVADRMASVLGARGLNSRDHRMETCLAMSRAGTLGNSLLKHFLNDLRGSPGGSVVKSLPANAWDMGLTPDPGRSYKLQSV